MKRASRREFLGLIASIPVSVVLAKSHETTSSRFGGSQTPFNLPPLPYPYDALEPVIDAQTMRLHHDKHHAAYVENLNKALAAYPELAKEGLEPLLRELDKVPESIRTAVRNHGGGHWNHTLFWEIMTPGGAQEPSGKLGEAIRSTFSSFEKFREQFEQAGLKVFGSGWVWLVVNSEKKLEIVTTPNQDTPLSMVAQAVIGNDVWEHAYYLKYQNRRGEYLKAWWKVVNWDVAARNFDRALS